MAPTTLSRRNIPAPTVAHQRREDALDLHTELSFPVGPTIARDAVQKTR